MSTVAVVTGASSGIGYSVANALLARGCKVYGLNRRELPDRGIVYIKTDLCNEASVEAAIDSIIEAEGKIDILINNAGCGISGAVEYTDTENAISLFDLNFFGMVRVIRSVVPHMRECGKGRIVNISSVAAVTPIPFQAYYSATKAAVLNYSMALANELEAFGISVCSVLPGDIKTGFTGSRKKIIEGDDIYCGRMSRSVSKMEYDEQNGMSADKAGKYIASVALAKRVKPMYSIGFGYKCITVLACIFPKSFVNYLIKKIYAN